MMEKWAVIVAGNVRSAPLLSTFINDGQITGFTKDPKTYFCIQCGIFSCAKCSETDVTNHPHQLICMWLKRIMAADDFWMTVVNGFWRFCDICKGPECLYYCLADLR
jgi:hypothetical protein